MVIGGAERQVRHDFMAVKLFGGVVNKRPEIFLAVGRPPRLPF